MQLRDTTASDYLSCELKLCAAIVFWSSNFELLADVCSLEFTPLGGFFFRSSV
jgi:hypothetical protein